ncbi:delta-lactam-biosynthetic de-N-acetylase [Paraliobacillus ryukyuensis]|uniref:delta-lactam-biosynthetic de-N-acetylase n=1 Tax=Paraliobacillus ryukyuensis TaxID=200904 RepID=UPI0009A6FDEB|nr:delta-lactam-biosynthetic de-N-acetylase [Paraliobacillus ryukyuensis]
MLKKLWLMTFALAFVITTLPSIVSAQSYGWGYKKGSNNQPPEVGEYGKILEENGGYYMDNSGDKVIYLTFDNGYEAGHTEYILDVLKEKEVPATFFVTGHYVRSQPDLIKRMVKEGHILGNHSDSHGDFTKMSKAEIKKELSDLDQEVAAITDLKKLQYVRPPRGTFNAQTIQWSNELGYTHVFWSLAFVDWHKDKEKGWKSAYQEVMKQIHPGAVILLHTVSKDNAEAVPYFIDDLRKQGYQFKSLDDLVMKNTIPKPLFGL